MDNAFYTTLNRQSGLLREMQSVANNLANMSTNGYRREGVIFSEFVQDLGPDNPSLSMATGRVRETGFLQGALSQTGGQFDLAIEGQGFFLIGAPEGELLTRAGRFTLTPDGTLTTAEGYPLLDAGGAPVFAPPDARSIAIGADGTLSADGNPIGQIGLWQPTNPMDLTRREGVRFQADGGVQPADGSASIRQGFLESSNVSPVEEITRMIEVQRAYELGQSFLDKEDERIRSVLRAVAK